MNRQRPSSMTHITISFRLLLATVAIGALLLLGVTTAGQLAAELGTSMIITTITATVSTIRTYGQPARTGLAAPPDPGGHPITTNHDERALAAEGEDGE